jgi:hypothetical protein
MKQGETNMKTIRHLSLFLIALVLAACSNQPKGSAYTSITPASIQPGDAIPAPANDVILTVTGGTGVKNSGDALVLDMATLEKLGLVEYSVNDPWLNAKNTYTGVLMSDFLKYIGVPSSATQVHMTALDDYQVDISIADIQKWPILLATRVNGEYMNIENNGPTRIIFPYDSFPDIDQVSYKDLWMWNLKSMEIK